MNIQELNAADAIQAIEDSESPIELEEWRASEIAGKGRKTVLTAIDNALAEYDFGDEPESKSEPVKEAPKKQENSKAMNRVPGKLRKRL